MIPNVPVGIPMMPSESGQSFSISNLFIGGSPSLSWNVQYNEGVVLHIPEDNGTNKNVVLSFISQPFNYIDITTTSATPVKLVINNVPPNWWLVHNESPFHITISPQINGANSYQNTNEKTLDANSHYFIAIMPGVPPLVNQLANPTVFKLS